MNKNINLIAFGTFGNPNGFRQTFFIGNKELSDKVKTFDLNTNAIKLLPNTKIFAIRKENINGLNSISYSLYNYAKEQNSDRSGTFIGSSILYVNEIAEENISISLLNDFNENLLNKNVVNDTIAVSHSDNLDVSKPKDFDKANYHLKKIEEINFNQFSNKNLVVYSEIRFEKLKVLFSNSLDLLNIYDTIYFTDSNEVAEYVHQKGMFKLLQVTGFEQEIESLHIERKQKIENSITNFSSEKLKLEEDKRSLISDLKFQIQSSELLHAENQRNIDESKKNIHKIEAYHQQFSQKIDDYTNQLKSGAKLNQVIELYNENKRIFVSSINEVKQPNFTKKIQVTKSNSNLQTERRPSVSNTQWVGNDGDFTYNRIEKQKPKFDLFEILTAVFAFLWIVTSIYFIWFNKEEAPPVTVERQKEKTEISPTISEPIKIKTLNPEPNSRLNINDLNIINKQKVKNKSSNEIVEIIFQKNPTDIANYYFGQKDLYIKRLIETNLDCFQNNICIKEDLKDIPSYKKQ